MVGTVCGLTIRNSDTGSPWDPGTQPGSPECIPPSLRACSGAGVGVLAVRGSRAGLF